MVLKKIMPVSDKPMVSPARRHIPRNKLMRPRTSLVFPKKAMLPKTMERVESSMIM